jgi:hypothetical protein
MTGNSNKVSPLAVPWFMQFVADPSPRSPRFDPKSAHVGFMVDKVAPGQFFHKYFGFPQSLAFIAAPLHGKNENKITIFITGLHNKP